MTLARLARSVAAAPRFVVGVCCAHLAFAACAPSGELVGAAAGDPGPPAGDALGAGDAASPGDGAQGGDDGVVDPDLNPGLIAARPYTSFVPSSAPQPMPLVLALHGLGSTGAQQVLYMGLLSRAEADGFIVAYPDGLAVAGTQSWNASCCGLFPGAPDDLTYLRAVVADVRARHPVDPKRIYALGLSNGAFMANLLACESSSIFAAVAPLAGTLWSGEEGQCQPTSPVAVLTTHGTADLVVLYDGGTFGVGGPTYLGEPALVEHWRARNGCDPTGDDDTADVDAFQFGAETQVRRFTGCSAAVEQWTIPGGAHVPVLTDTYKDAVIDFLLSHPKP